MNQISKFQIEATPDLAQLPHQLLTSPFPAQLIGKGGGGEEAMGFRMVCAWAASCLAGGLCLSPPPPGTPFGMLLPQV